MDGIKKFNIGEWVKGYESLPRDLDLEAMLAVEGRAPKLRSKSWPWRVIHVPNVERMTVELK